MMKFAKHVYRDCKKSILGGPTAFGYAAGLYIGYLYSRTNKLVHKTLKPVPEFEQDLEDKLYVSAKALMNSTQSVSNGLDKHSETLDRFFEKET